MFDHTKGIIYLMYVWPYKRYYLFNVCLTIQKVLFICMFDHTKVCMFDHTKGIIYLMYVWPYKRYYLFNVCLTIQKVLFI